MRHATSLLCQNHQKISATEPVTMELNSITMDSPVLENLINARISAKEKIIDKLISYLTNQVNSITQKNEQGRSFQGPSQEIRKARRKIQRCLPPKVTQTQQL
jgi:hypothetical protein